MAVAAVRALAQRIDRQLWIVAHPLVAPIWRRLHHADRVLSVQKSLSGTWRLAQQLRKAGIKQAYVLPGSTRAALVTRLAGISRRTGYDGDFKRYFLNDMPPLPGEGQWHKSLDYYALIHGEEAIADLIERSPAERLRLPSLLHTPFHNKPAPAAPAVDLRRIALIPGAARGPAKRWPTAHFGELAQRLLSASAEANITILGAPDDRPFGAQIAACAAEHQNRLDDRTGQTSIEQWLDAIASSALVVCNDSGGMHVADGFGRPLVALFGTTDPSKTGPASASSVAMQKSHFASEKISRDSKESQRALSAITADEVYRQCVKMLEWLRTT